MTNKLRSVNNLVLSSALFITLGLCLTPALVLAQAAAADVTKNAQVSTSNAGTAVRVAPGELLPISVRLANFGGGTRVDVLIRYAMTTTAGDEIFTSNETVAVETTANFVKTIQVPATTAPGTYIAKTSITYQGQVVPATTQFSFTVERKFLGLFQNDIILYGGITVVVAIIMGFVGHALIKRRRPVRLSPFDYSDVPHDMRTFFEILSDTIMEMRGRVGDDALIIAANIEGLKIDAKNGQVLAVTAYPSKIIATLVFQYEQLLGKKVSFALRKDGKAEL